MIKKRLGTIITMFVLLVFSFTNISANVALSSNIISNPGFENGMTGWLPKHVSNATPDRILGTEGGSATVENSIGRNGSRALKIVQGNQVEGGALTAWARAEYHFLPNEVPKIGSAYLFSAWVKAESIPANVTPSIQMIMGLGADQGQEYLHYQDEVLYSGVLTTEWQRFTGVTRMMSFEQQDSPNTQYKGLIGFHSSPKYPGANPGFDQGIQAAAPLKEFYAYVILAPGPSQAIPLIIDDVEVLKPVYNFIFDNVNADSKLLYKESDSYIYVHENTDIAVYREVIEDAYFIYKLDFTSNATDAILTLSLADDYKIELATSDNGPWTTVATGRRLLMSGAYKADEIIDLKDYLKKNNENAVYVKFSDNTPGSTGTARNGLQLRALEVFSKTGTLEFKLDPQPTSVPTTAPTKAPTAGITPTKAPTQSESSIGSSETPSDSSDDISQGETYSETENSDTDSSGSEASQTPSESDQDIILDSSIIKPLYTDVILDYNERTVSVVNKISVKELIESFELGEGYSIKVVDKNGSEISDETKLVSSDMKINILKDGVEYSSLKIIADEQKDSNFLLIIIIVIISILILGSVSYVLYKKEIITPQKVKEIFKRRK